MTPLTLYLIVAYLFMLGFTVSVVLSDGKSLGWWVATLLVLTLAPVSLPFIAGVRYAMAMRERR